MSELGSGTMSVEVSGLLIDGRMKADLDRDEVKAVSAL